MAFTEMSDTELIHSLMDSERELIAARMRHSMNQLENTAGLKVLPNIKPWLLTCHPKFAELAAQGGFVKTPDGISIELLQDGYLEPQEPWASMENSGSW